MTQKFLRGFEVYTSRPKIGRQRVTEAVPADRFAFNPRSLEGRTDDFLEQSVRGQGLLSFAPYRREQEIGVPCIWRFLPPNTERLHHARMKRNRFAARFGLGVSEVIPHTRPAHVDLHEFEVDVGPSERDKLGSPQAGSPGKHHHGTFPQIEHCYQ